MLSNLIGNAIDAMRRGGRLLVWAHHVSEQAGKAAGARITVADTGHGISAEARKRIFEPFFCGQGLKGNGVGALDLGWDR